jgi:fumarate reductase (CoM/CoB) subunit B
LDSNQREILKKILESCIGHKSCSSDCQILQELGELTPRDVAEQVLSGEIDENVRNYVIRCDLCGLCTQSCPENLDIPALVMAARQVLLESGVTDVELYRAMWVDHDWNAFTLYRDTYQIDYTDLIKTQCETLFFPGCALSSEAPEVTRAAITWLAEHVGEVGLLPMCCGQPLAQIGLTERAEQHMNLVLQMAHETGAHRIVTACPLCHYHLHRSEKTEGTELVSIYQLMSDAGVRVKNLGSGKITIHDSCPDREQQRIGPCVREILSDYEIAEMAHHGKQSICCGSGGIVSAVDPELCTQRASRRLMEFNDVGADICITYCMACANRLSRVFGPGRVRHLLELVFNQSVDHTQNADRAKAMWEAEWGKYNIYRLENSHLLEPLR